MTCSSSQHLLALVWVGRSGGRPLSWRAQSGARTIVLDADIHAVAFYQHMGAVLVDIADSADIPIASTPRMRYELPEA